MRLSELSIRNPVFAWMLMLGLIFFGYLSFTRMGVSQMPDVDFPMVSISLSSEGSAPEVMETDVADVIEDALSTVEGVRSLKSVSRFGNTTISAEFDLDRDIDAAMQDVQGKISQSMKSLPRQLDPPVISKTNPDDQPILWLSLSSTKHSMPEIMRFLRDRLKDKFTTVPGVGEVILAGYVDPSLRVWVSNDKLSRLDLTVVDLLNAIQSEHAEVPAGQLELGARESDLRTIGEASSLDEFSRIILTRRGSQPNYSNTRLSEVARVEEGLADVRRLSRFNGETSVGLGIKKQRGANAVEVAKLVKKRMAQVENSLPEGMDLHVNFDTTRFIEQSTHGLEVALLLAAIFTALVCWGFLGSWSSTFNVLMAIPTSIVGAFIGLHAFGFTLNTFTLLGLSLAIGIVVDDAIMVLENIVRHREMGKSRLESARVGSQEITFAAMAATVAIVAIFLPVAFMRGVIGKFFFQFGITMTVTVLLSLLEALTLTPMRCSRFVEPAHRTTFVGRGVERALAALGRGYQHLLGGVLRFRYITILAAIGFFIVSLLPLKQINREFVPAQDQSVFLGRLQAAVDSSLAFTDEKSREVETFIRAIPEVSHVFSAVGGFGGGQVNTATLFISLKEKGARGKDKKLGRERTQAEIMDLVREGARQFKGVRLSLQDLSMRGFSASRGFPVEFTIRGPDWDKLSEFARQIGEELNRTELVSDLDTDYQLGKPEVRILPDRRKAADRGVSVRDISQTVGALVGGVAQGRYAMGGHRYDIRVRLEPSDRDRIEQIKALQVRNNRGVLVRLGDVIEIQEKPSLQQITRLDRERAVSVFANVKVGASQALALEKAEAIGKKILPKGYRLVMGGSSQTFAESFKDLKLALVLGLVIAYMVLGSQFNSFKDPITVLLALPFSLSGAVLALWLWGVSLNIYSFIGLILLMGIVKKNSILLVEFTHQVRAQKPELAVNQALLEACPVRLRPILMTSVATIAAAVPEAIDFGAGAETRIPMAVTVIGGVLVSTVLTLFVVPCVYSVFSNPWAGFWRFGRKDRRRDIGVAVASGMTGFLLLFMPIEARALSLKEALDRGLKAHPSVRVAEERIEEATALESSAFARHFPTLSVNGNAYTRKDAAIAGNAAFGGEAFNLYQVQLQGSVPIFRGFAFSAQARTARVDEELRRVELELSRRALSLDIIESYLGVLREQSRVEAFESRLKLDDGLLRLGRERERIGRSQRLDVLQIQAQIALFKPQLMQAQAERDLQLARLRAALGAQGSEDLGSPSGELRKLSGREVRELLAREGYQKSTTALLEIRQSELGEERVSAQNQVLLAPHWPTLNAVGTVASNSFSRSELFDPYAASWTAGLELSIPLFTGLSVFSDFRAKQARTEAALYQMEQAANAVHLEQARTERSLSAAYEMDRLASEAESVSQKVLAEARRNFSLSTIDYQQLLNVQRDALQAELMAIGARFELASAAARWIAARSLGLAPFVEFLDQTLSGGK